MEFNFLFKKSKKIKKTIDSFCRRWYSNEALERADKFERKSRIKKLKSSWQTMKTCDKIKFVAEEMKAMKNKNKKVLDK